MQTAQPSNFNEVPMRRVLAGATVLAFAAACGGKDGSDGADSASGAIGATTAAAPATPPAPVLTDENIVAKGLMSDSMEITLGKMAQSKGTDAAVKEFARMLVTDHTKDAKEMTALATSKSLTPQPAPSDTAAQSMHAQHASLEQMQKGKDFDAAFVSANVAMHQQAIADVQAAQGRVQSPELRAHLEKMLPTLQKHLERAQALQQKLAGTAQR